MPQGPIPAAGFISGTNAVMPRIDPGYGLRVHGGGHSTALNVSGTEVIKTGPGWAGRVQFVSAGTAGSYQLYDAATTGAIATSNAITPSMPYSGSVVSGGGYDIEMPVTNGLVISCTTNGVAAVSFD